MMAEKASDLLRNILSRFLIQRSLLLFFGVFRIHSLQHKINAPVFGFIYICLEFRKEEALLLRCRMTSTLGWCEKYDPATNHKAQEEFCGNGQPDWRSEQENGGIE